MLTKEQKRFLGSKPPQYIWDEIFSSLHSVANPDSLGRYEITDEQSFDEFKEMGKRNPNPEGTGRWKITSKRNKIGVVWIKKKNQTKKKAAKMQSCIESIANLISAFSCLGTDVISLEGDEDICLFPKEGKILAKGSSFPLNTFQSVYNKNRLVLDVFSLFDMLVEYAKPPYVSIVAFVDEELGEEADAGEGVEGSDYYEVLGRACGDRVACVSTSEPKIRDLFATAMHEAFHTVGLDHCTTWNCLMNPSSCDQICVTLSPLNLRKLLLMHKVPEKEGGHFLVKRYQSIISAMRTFRGNPFRKDISWIENKLDLLRGLNCLTVVDMNINQNQSGGKSMKKRGPSEMEDSQKKKLRSQGSKMTL
mmetsp:Transcript_22119/g.28650  ORF Transcript_22119/g.28650 Transcript_22119/m.28650 type:complete len:363 (-) Transcript_22119:103-1191(-)